MKTVHEYKLEQVAAHTALQHAINIRRQAEQEETAAAENFRKATLAYEIARDEAADHEAEQALEVRIGSLFPTTIPSNSQP